MTAKAEPGTGLALQGKLSNDVNQAFSGPLTDQTGTLVRYEIRMTQSEFDQIVQGNYYKKGATSASSCSGTTPPTPTSTSASSR